ncbi:lipoprotein [Massilia sp. TS11]|nr:lipoprotein [Massilia sp. TS11]MCG2584905.1 lipoprotein [Massilia sp. TS11]
MKSTLLRNTATVAVVLGLLSACGQPGPLYMPKPPAKASASSSASVPETK